MADIVISITDGTTTATPLVIVDARVKVTAAALSAAIGDTAPPASDVRAVRAALAKFIAAARRQHRRNLAERDGRAVIDQALAVIDADEAGS